MALGNTPPPDPVESDQLKPLLLEYERLKFEQAQRIGFRDNLLYFGLGATGAAIGFALGAGHAAAWYLVPPVGLVLGWTYLANDTKITGIGAYIRSDLRLRVETLSPRHYLRVGVFGWEDSPHKSPRRGTKKPIQLIVDLAAFVLPALIAPIAFMIQTRTDAWWAIAAGVAVWIVALRLAREIAYESDINRLSDLKPLITEWRIRKPNP